MIYQWAVIGAGPAGIAAIGKLLDSGIPENEIIWLDPQFAVGDFGTLWRNVAGNTKVELFIRFLKTCPAFNYADMPDTFALKAAQKNKTCPLQVMAEALQWVTDRLKNRVKSLEDFAKQLSLKNRIWHIETKKTEVLAKNIILCTGAEAKKLPFSQVSEIPLSHALDHQAVKKYLDSSMTVAVFGSSHSAILALRNLVENSVKHVVNFYQEPLKYAVYLDDWILFDDTGLKGTTAEWAREYLDGNLPQNVSRVFSNAENIERHLPFCDKVIYAIGFEKRSLPMVEGFPHLNYIPETGIIAPGLFGLGIGFPEAKYNPLGVLEYRVGLWKFMDYLNRMLPIWRCYSS